MCIPLFIIPISPMTWKPIYNIKITNVIFPTETSPLNSTHILISYSTPHFHLDVQEKAHLMSKTEFLLNSFRLHPSVFTSLLKEYLGVILDSFYSHTLHLICDDVLLILLDFRKPHYYISQPSLIVSINLWLLITSLVQAIQTSSSD